MSHSVVGSMGPSDKQNRRFIGSLITKCLVKPFVNRQSEEIKCIFFPPSSGRVHYTVRFRGIKVCVVLE